MKRALRPSLAACFLALLGASACGGGDAMSKPPVAAVAPTGPAAAPPVTPDFRSQPPTAGPAVVFVPPKVSASTLANGVRVLVAEQHELPIVSVMIVLRTPPTATPGLASFASGMLMQGTRTRSALQISDEIERLGGSAHASSDYEAAFVSGRFLAENITPAVALLADLTTLFDAAEVERFRSRRLTALAQQQDSPGAVLTRTIDAVLYPPSHPYATPLLGTEEATARVTPAALAAHWKDVLRPDAMAVIFAGDITAAAARAEAERALGLLTTGAAAPRPPVDLGAAAGAGPKVVLVDRPGATQSSVAVSLVGVPRKTPDYDALEVMNTILGGQFSSRLNLNLREKHAFSYGAYSGFQMRVGAGPFRAGGEIVRESTGPAVKEIRAEIDRMRTDLVSEEELANAKTYLLRALPARFETTTDVTSALAELVALDLPLDEYATLTSRVEKVTREDVRRVAEKALTPDAARIVVVGDAAVVKDQLASLGVGDVDVRAVASTPPTKGAAAAPHGPAAPRPAR